ncbi:MAG: acyl-CoA dehydrogenase family protein [Nitriliruptorales bacterium]|nr:acyl-CoA dehydrogenase family protein [Nitriliruptorales bacterium]
MAEPGVEQAPKGAPRGMVDLLADDEDLAALRALARELADKELAPRAAENDEEEAFPEHAWKALAQAGLFGVTVGEQWGGAGMGDRASAVVLEELARADVSAAIMIQLAMNGAPRAVEHLANDALRDRWLPRAASGEDLFCIGITESEAGSATQNMLARLEPDGDGWRLHAYKNYVTGGHKASACLVWARWPGGDGAKGIGGVLVDLSAEGVSVTGIHKKMGLRSMSEAELAFDGVAITPDDVVIAGNPDNHDAFRTLLGHLNHERAGNAAMCIGAAQGALEHAVRYANERILNGRPIAELQGIQWKFADMAVALESARLLLYRAVSLAPEHGTPPALETAMAKTAANEAAKQVCDEAIQILGGYGYSREYPVERMYRDIRGLCIGAGTIEVQKNYVGSRVSRGSAPAGPAWRNPVG